MPPLSILTVSNLAKTYITDEIFSNVNFQILEREHVALVGVNGAGKSTVLRIIAGIEHANAGEVITAAGLRVTYRLREGLEEAMGQARAAGAHYLLYTRFAKADDRIGNSDEWLDQEAVDRLGIDGDIAFELEAFRQVLFVEVNRHSCTLLVAPLIPRPTPGTAAATPIAGRSPWNH